MSKQEIKRIINQLAANPVTARKLSAQMLYCNRHGINPVLIVDGKRIRLIRAGSVPRAGDAGR